MRRDAAAHGGTGVERLAVPATGDELARLAVTLNGPGDTRVTYSVPSFISRGAELGEVTRIVIRAWERMDRSAGVGS